MLPLRWREAEDISPSTNALDVACTEQNEAIGFASILTIGEDAAPKSKKRHGKGEENKKAGVAAVSVGPGFQPYIPMKLPLSRDAHLKAMAVSLEVGNAVLPSSLSSDPMLPLAATLAIFRAMLNSLSVVS